MIEHIRMLENRDGAYDHIHVVTYQEGEIYSLQRDNPPISQELLDGFVASGHAVEVNASGDPVGNPAAKRQTKPTGPKATKAADSEPEPSAPNIPDTVLARFYPQEDEPTEGKSLSDTAGSQEK